MCALQRLPCRREKWAEIIGQARQNYEFLKDPDVIRAVLNILQDVHTKFEDAALEISGSLLLERNIFLALLSLQSWKPFMQRWLRPSITALDAKAHSTVLDNTSKAASGILKVLPASAHDVHTMASEFLLSWLSQYEHEYRRWSAAISLGLISSCLHVTDHEQKFKNITTLLEVVVK